MVTVASPALRPVFIFNRKFMGSKQNLLAFIGQVLDQVCPRARTACDPFTGSGAVAYYLARRGLQVTAADHLYSNYAAARAFLTTHPGNASMERLAERIAALNRLPGRPGYVWEHFGGTYFTPANAARIDSVREQIAAWAAAGLLTEQEELVLITSLLYAADKVANTCGQYDAFLKHLGNQPYGADGTHLVDAMVYRPLELGLPQPVADGERHRALCADANRLVAAAEVDLLYLDPPYNTRQYVDNYHVLENIARWERPALLGKTRKFPRAHLKSRYSSRIHATAALQELIAAARCRHLLLSYNNEGIVPDAAILAALRRRGPVEVFTADYTVFGNGAGRSRRRRVVERLFYCQVRSPGSGPPAG